MKLRLWIVSELYAPDAQATSRIMTRIAEGLVEDFEVRAVCAHPTMQFEPFERTEAEETRKEVVVRRLRSMHLDKSVVLFRALNLMSISIPIFVHLLIRLRSGDRVLVVTNPPILPFIAAAAARLRGAKCVVLVHDVYPDVLVPTGFLRVDGWIYRAAQASVRRLFSFAHAVVAIGRDMRERLLAYVDPTTVRLDVVPNWSEPNRITARPKHENRILRRLGLDGQFVVLHAGTMGRIHGIENILEAAGRVQEDPRIHFLFAGVGVKRALVEQVVRAGGPGRLTLMPFVDEAEQNELLNACDVAIIAMIRGMTGISVPSRLYNTLASGRPIIAVTEPDSELARVIAEADVGWVVPPGDVDALVQVIATAAKEGEKLLEKGKRARLLAETTYTADASIGALRRVLISVGDSV